MIPITGIAVTVKKIKAAIPCTTEATHSCEHKSDGKGKYWFYCIRCKQNFDTTGKPVIGIANEN